MVTEIATRDRLQPSLLDRLTDDEPSILRHTRRAKVRVAQGEMNHSTLRFEIEGDLWMPPRLEYPFQHPALIRSPMAPRASFFGACSNFDLLLFGI
ncbi:hypothetical protein H097_01507 [Pseudomonas sp. FH4]|uniref:hypothetical protein n=1 Tax=Pseudomonas fluorescens group TaxID=136843 RepID=UPI0003DD676D|nr:MULTISPECIES: hypothetical protein [Pseudomonas fluorescens group]ETK21195.1 hypothetical protein H097_01507 [Pseudomonas sp. FH4]MBF8004088.1 hypothetical protein [Pseudomonas brenneri]WJM94284.1 hypothetical protein QDY63_00325 [Pseudomonas brenneri]